jgi:hypothetical protein
MNIHQRRSPGVLALMILAAALLTGPVFAGSGLLDGKRFTTEEGDAGKPAKVRDNVLTFSEGKFHSKECDQWGYGKGEVQASQEGDAIRFETETRSEKYGTRQVWKGVVKGNAIEGTRVMYPKPSFFRPNPNPVEGWFKGTLKTE